MILPVKKHWFSMMLTENEETRKKEEYREHKPYWGKRYARRLGFRSIEELDKYIIRNGATQPFLVTYRNGYSNNSPSFDAIVTLSLKRGKVIWGAEPGVEYYTSTIQEIKTKRNCK